MRKGIRNKKIMQKKNVKLKSKKSNNSGFIKLLIWITGAASAVMLGFYLWKFHDHSFSETPADWGNFGDYIGSITGLLAFLGVLYSLTLTEKRAEKIEERDVFFKLMEMHQKALDSIKRVIDNKVVEAVSPLTRYVNIINNILYEYSINSSIVKLGVEGIDKVIKENSNDYLSTAFIQQCKFIHKRNPKYSSLNDQNVHIDRDFVLSETSKLIDQTLIYKASEHHFGDKQLFLKSNIYDFFIPSKFTMNDMYLALKLTGNYMNEEYGALLGRYFETMHYILKTCRDFQEDYFELYRAQLSRNEVILCLCYAMSDKSVKGDTNDELIELLLDKKMLNGFYFKDLFLTHFGENWKGKESDFIDSMLVYRFPEMN